MYPSIKKKYESSVKLCQKGSLNFNGINFPVAIKDIPKIEKMNNISVNGFENKRTFPLYLSNFQSSADTSFQLLAPNQRFGDTGGAAPNFG